MIELIVQSGKHQGKCLRLPSEGEVMIGRDELCQIRLASSDVSRHHCVLRMTPDGVVARDLDSRNGTYLNETLMEEETLLKPGDILRIGPIVLQVPGAPVLPLRRRLGRRHRQLALHERQHRTGRRKRDDFRRYDDHSAARGAGHLRRTPRRSAPPIANRPASSAASPKRRPTSFGGIGRWSNPSAIRDETAARRQADC